MACADLSYNDLVVRFGKDMAFDFLLTIEKLAKIKDNIIELDEEKRFDRAIQALDDASKAS